MFKFDLRENEKLITSYRQTEAILFTPVIMVFVLIYFPWYFLLKYELAATYSRWLLIWTVLVFLYALNKYVLWLLNTYLVTDKRVVCIRYQSLFNKTVLESPLDRILNVSFSSKGFWAALFQFGTVEVQVSGLAEPLTFKNIAHPSEAKDFLWKIHNKQEKKPVPPQVFVGKTNFQS